MSVGTSELAPVTTDKFLHISEYLEWCKLNGVSSQEWIEYWTKRMVPDLSDVIETTIRVED